MKVVLLALALAACSKAAPPPDLDHMAVPTITVDELAAALPGVQAVDANDARTRAHMGVIPGAVLLTDYDAFAASELPADHGRPLVFYCVNTSCDASHHAAAKAIATGYTNVKVLQAGIAGWVKAGKQVTSI